MIAIQLDFFETQQQSEIVALRKELSCVKSSTEKVRKGLFSRNGELQKKIDDLNNRLQIIERNICNIS